MSLLQGLNKEQKEAVKTVEGPMLVIAGAGSGKTRVLTHRIANLVKNEKVSPHNILAITFTNKAASEMRERINELVGARASEIWVSTFHSTCVRILRRHVEYIGYTSNFTIYDDDDKKKIVKEAMIKLNINEQKILPRSVMNYISSNKNQFIKPEDAITLAGRDPIESKYAKSYKLYEEMLRQNNGMDFDDLIGKTIELFETTPKVLKEYQERFKYILVDEYQDTNHAQYLLVKMLGAKYKNVFVVGDDDQSIYRWRGADISNILNFEKDYKNAKVIRLEQNYRSTGNILNLANSVIDNNTQRKPKKLWTEEGDGDITTVYYAYDERDEAGYVSSVISQRVADKSSSYKDFAILYRTNAQSRVIEEQFVKDNIPYQIFGGVRFYERKEIKDILAYLKVILNSRDEVSIKRIINVPKRNIGNTTLDKIEACAQKHSLYLYETLRDCSNYKEINKLDYKIERFTSIIEEIKEMEKSGASLKDMVETLIENTKYVEMLEEEETQDARNRIENIREFVSKVTHFEMTTEGATLEKFLEEVSLLADIDNLEDENNTVKLMTIHTSKGLEFKTVFLVGFEDGIFPSYLSIFEDKDNEIEEERRLLYVAITRARSDLHISYTKSRIKNGQVNHNKVSRFYDEFPKELIELKKKKVKKLKLDLEVHEKPKPNLYSMIKDRQEAREMLIPKEVAVSFKVGDSVGHKKFGKGLVQGISPAGADYEVTVNFDGIGTKKLMSTFANLERL